MLTRSFYGRDTLLVAHELIGRVLVSTFGGEIVSGRIVETEAYRGSTDEASHAGRRRTERNSVMFGRPGHAYVYFSYGMHHLFNIVSDVEGEAGAVLIRALEPLYGLDVMVERRRCSVVERLCSGPACLTQALAIDLRHDRTDLTVGEDLAVYDDDHTPGAVLSGPRVGISRATDLPWRFCLAGSAFVSKPRLQPGSPPEAR